MSVVLNVTKHSNRSLPGAFTPVGFNLSLFWKVLIIVQHISPSKSVLVQVQTMDVLHLCSGDLEPDSPAQMQLLDHHRSVDRFSAADFLYAQSSL